MRNAVREEEEETSGWRRMTRVHKDRKVIVRGTLLCKALNTVDDGTVVLEMDLFFFTP